MIFLFIKSMYFIPNIRLVNINVLKIIYGVNTSPISVFFVLVFDFVHLFKNKTRRYYISE